MSGQNFWNTKPLERLGIPSMMLTDGPHGLRKQGGAADHLGLHNSLPATCFPTMATLANSWDVSLLESVGEYIGQEAAANDVSVVLGPGLNIKRNPLCGRNFEYFSEDPFLSGKMAAAMIRGIQAQGVSACPKHFAVNSQELRRMVIDEIVDERAFRELYLEGFRYALQEGKAKTIMTSYNRINGVFANENPHLLRDILYDEWGFEGLVVTDWGGNNDRVAALIAGSTLEMPTTAGMTDREIVEAVRRGEVDERILDEQVDRLLCLVFDTLPALGKGKHYTEEQHNAAARDAARRSIVLLKNEDRLLPIASDKRVAVIGDFAETPRYQGSGSSLINPTRLENALDALNSSKLNIVGYEPGFKRLGGKSRSRLNRAVKLAEKADIALLFLGLDEGGEAEGLDRFHMHLSENQLVLLDAVSQVCENIVVVLSCGASIEMPWAGKAKSILHAYLGGQAGGGAVADVLTGAYNPSGKLAETYPVKYEDVSCADNYPGEQLTAEHRESIFIGYRYFDSLDKPVTWPFGHGLTYTSFEYGGLSLNQERVSFTVRNTGEVFGEEIAQVYVSKPESRVFRAKLELKGFAKIALAPGDTKEVVIAFDEHSFKYFNVAQNDWLCEPGQYNILVGASSRDIRLQGSLELEGEAAPNPYDSENLPHYFSGDVQNVSAEEFETLLGRKLPPCDWDKSAPFGYNDTIGQGEYKKGFGHFLYKLVRFVRRIFLILGRPIAANNVMFAMNLPYRHLARMTGGRIDMAMLDGILVMANGHFWKGLGQTLKAHRQKKKDERERTRGK